MSHTFVWWSESGGPGKTTNTMQTAAAIGRDGYDVLAWDLDPQRGALTHYCGHGHLDHDNDTVVDPTIMDVFFGDAHPHDLVVETPHFDLLPGHEDLANFESALASSGRRGADEFWVIRELLEGLASDYDVFILDVQATLNKLVDNALIGARSVMVPVELTPKGDASQRGLEATLDSLDSGFDRMGVDIVIRGTVPSRVGNAKIFDDYREKFEARGVPLSPFAIPEHSLLRYTWDEQLDLFSFIEADHTRALRDYEKHVPLAYKVIGRWMVGDYSYDDAVARWDDVREMEMGDADPERVLDQEVSI